MTNEHRMSRNKAVLEGANRDIEEHKADPWIETYLLSEISPVLVYIPKIPAVQFHFSALWVQESQWHAKMSGRISTHH